MYALVASLVALHDLPSHSFASPSLSSQCTYPRAAIGRRYNCGGRAELDVFFFHRRLFPEAFLKLLSVTRSPSRWVHAPSLTNKSAMNLLTDETLDAIRRGLAVTPRTLPSPEIRENIINRHRELVEAIEAHQAWTLNPPHPGLFHVWDFVNRSMYIMSELGNIAAGRPVRYPEQIPPNPHGEFLRDPTRSSSIPVTPDSTRDGLYLHYLARKPILTISISHLCPKTFVTWSAGDMFTNLLLPPHSHRQSTLSRPLLPRRHHSILDHRRDNPEPTHAGHAGPRAR